MGITMLLNALYLIASLAVLFFGAEWLVRGSASAALRLGLTPLVVGLTVVAFGTSAPELVVSFGAALDGLGNIAIGNVVGSNIFNIAVILGLAAVICPIPVHLSVIRLDAPVMIGLSLLMIGALAGEGIGRAEGAGLLAALGLYTAFNVYLARRTSDVKVEQEFQQAVPAATGSVWRDIIRILAGLVLLVAGSRLLVVSAVAIARLWGVSDAIIGLTVVSAGTSMPELATSVIAALRRQPDIAVGNVVGSNIFNILGILGASALAAPLHAPGIDRVDLAVMVGFAAALFPLLYTGRRLLRWEGTLLLLAYGLYLWKLWPTG
jgi:cation:H+ antiporter